LEPKKYSKYINDENISKKSITVSLENLGWLEKEPLKNRYINWIGNIYNGKTFERKWRDYFLWQPYTEVQIDSTILICKKLMENFPFIFMTNLLFFVLLKNTTKIYETLIHS
jgi:N-acetyl-anhydromuramyl-L-alanine amidase AmpD